MLICVLFKIHEIMIQILDLWEIRDISVVYFSSIKTQNDKKVN